MTQAVDVQMRHDPALLLEEACERARRWDFDMPSDAAYSRANGLLVELDLLSPQLDDLEACLAEDGTIEITVVTPAEVITVDVSLSGNRLEMVAEDRASGAMLASLPHATEADVVHRVARVQK